MAEDSQNTTNETKKQTGPRAQFPRLTLNKVLPLARQIYELGEGDPVPRLVVFDRLGKSPESGPSRMLITTSNAYGLTTGGYQAERLGITDRGRGLVQSTDKQIAHTHAVKALLDNELFAQFYDKYRSKGVPQEPVAVDYLKQTGNLSEADAKTAYNVFIANMTDYGFIKEMSGRPTIVGQELMELRTVEDVSAAPKDSPTPTIQPNVGSDAARTNPQQTANQGTILPQFNFNIQVQLPENASAEVYDAIFKSMSDHLLKASEQ